MYYVRKTLTRTDSDSRNVSETSFWETVCELKVAKKEKRGYLFLSSRLQTTHVCQCGQVERTRMADKADVGICDGTQTMSLFADCHNPPTVQSALRSAASRAALRSQSCHLL